MRTSCFVLSCLMLVAVNTGAQSIGPGAAIPAVANLPGIAGTFWQSDVTVYNPNENQVPIRLLLFPEIRGGEQAFDPMTSDQMTLPPSVKSRSRTSFCRSSACSTKKALCR